MEDAPLHIAEVDSAVVGAHAHVALPASPVEQAATPVNKRARGTNAGINETEVQMFVVGRHTKGKKCVLHNVGADDYIVVVEIGTPPSVEARLAIVKTEAAATALGRAARDALAISVHDLNLLVNQIRNDEMLDPSYKEHIQSVTSRLLSKRSVQACCASDCAVLMTASMQCPPTRCVLCCPTRAASSRG